MPSSELLNVRQILDYAERYNLLKSFEEQAHMVDSAALQRAAEILWKHSQHTKFGLVLLHRHVRLDAGQVVVQSMPEPDSIICAPRALGDVALSPSSFCLSHDGFFPLEFHLTETMAPNQEFLTELAEFIRESNLVDTLGISILAPGPGCWMEYERKSEAGTVAFPSESEGLIGAIVTEWQCMRDGSLLMAVARKKCVEPDSGGHVRNPPQ